MRTLILIAGGLLLGLGVATAQPTPVIPHYEQSYSLSSGSHAKAATATATERPDFEETVQVRDAKWLQLFFDDVSLGRGSYLLLTSEEDGAQQRLDAAALKAWQGRSAYFNGDAVRVELHVAPGDDARFEVTSLRVGQSGAAKTGPDGISTESICGSTDDRVDSSNPAVGRIVPIGCTGWIGPNGSFLSAGHCTAYSGFTTLEFNVPASDSDGSINHPPPQDQYPILGTTIESLNGGVGADWAVYDVGTSNGQRPIERQEHFYRLTRDSAPSTIRITGFGVDSGVDNQTNQTHAGPSQGETYTSANDVHFSYRADTEGGNSGSPVIVEGASTKLAVGIHTHGGCYSAGGENKGTSFEVNDLETAINTFPAASVRHADNGHPAAAEDGGALRPYDTFNEAIAAAADGDLISVARGAYATGAITIDKAVTIEAPVGPVTIGASSDSPALFGVEAPPVAAKDATTTSTDRPMRFALEGNYPNPVRARTTIRFAAPQAVHTRILVFDVLGRLVAEPVDATLRAGHHDVSFDASQLGSGVYFYRVEAGDFVETRRMVVVK